MSDKSWTVAVLNDIVAALPEDRYRFARYQLSDAIESIQRADTLPERMPHTHSVHTRLH